MFKKQINYTKNKTIETINYTYNSLSIIVDIANPSYNNLFVSVFFVSSTKRLELFYTPFGNNDLTMTIPDIFFDFTEIEVNHFNKLLSYYKSDINHIYKLFFAL